MIFKSFIKFIPSIVILIVGSIVVYLLNEQQSNNVNNVNNVINAEFNRESDDIILSFSADMQRNIDNALTLNAYANSNNRPLKNEIEFLLDDLFTKNIEVRAFGLAPKILLSEKKSFENFMQNEFGDQPHILNFDRSIAENRSIYFPLMHNRIFNSVTNSRLVDLYSSSSIKMNLDKANDNCDYILTNPLSSNSGETFVSLYDPFYDFNMPKDLSCDNKKNYLSGFTSFVMIPKDVLFISFKQFSKSGLYIKLIDVESNIAFAELINIDNTIRNYNGENFDTCYRNENISFKGREWNLQLRSLTNFNSALAQKDIPSLIVIGLVMLFLSFTLFIAFVWWEKKNLLLEKDIRQAELEKINTYALHEVRNPLNSIVLGILMMERNKDPDATKYIMESFKKSARQATRILDGMLELSKIDSSNYILHKKFFSINSLLREVTNVYLYNIKDKHLNFSFHVSKKLKNKYIYGHYSHILQSVSNFISNAIKYIHPHKNITLNIKLIKNDLVKNKIIISENTIKYFHENENILFEVIDEGIGIKDEDKHKIFNPFVQIENDMKTEAGTGIGLVITSKFVQLHGGTIGFNSEFNKGSRFYFTIPAIYKDLDDDTSSSLSINEDDKPYTIEEYNEIYSKITINTKTMYKFIDEEMGFSSDVVLIVEDNKENCVFLTSILQSEGFNVESCNNGLEALQKITSGKKYKTILMDNLMVPMDGITATKEISKIAPDITIYGTTGLTSEKDIDAFIKAGAKKVFPKPLDFYALLNEIKK